MAEHNPTRINRTGGTGKVQEFIPGTDTISGDFLTDSSITNGKIANDAITRLKMANLSVGPRELTSPNTPNTCLLYTSPSPRDS